MRSFMVALALAALVGGTASAQQPASIKISTWNLAWLTDRTPPEVPDNVKPKSSQGLQLLRRYAKELDAHIVAFAEVDGRRMIEKVFDPSAYEFHITDETDVQRPGFAVRKGINFTRNPDLKELDVNANEERSLRRGADITVTLFGQTIRMLAVHLKCCCPVSDLDSPNNDNCRQLAKQVPVLKAWIEARVAAREPFIILGDFNRTFNLKKTEGGRMIVDDMWRDLKKASAGLHDVTEGLTSNCWGGKHSQFIDHVVLSPEVKRLEVPLSVQVLVYRETEPRFEQIISDHCPVSVRLRTPS